MNSYADFFALQKGKYPNKTFLIYKDTRFTYEEFSEWVNRLGNGFKKYGIQPGDKVGIMGSNCSDWLLNYFSLISIGAVVVTVNPVLSGAEKVHIVNHCDLKALVLDTLTIPDFMKMKGEIDVSTVILYGEGSLDGAVKMSRLIAAGNADPCKVERDENDPCMIFHTGGTTSLPKSAVIPHRAFQWIMSKAPSAWHVTPEDRFLISSSMSFGMASGNILPIALGAGGTVIVAERFTPAIVCEQIEKNKVTIFTGVPTMYSMLLNYPEIDRHDLSSLRGCFSAGAPLLAEVVKKFWQKFNLVIHDYWGLTEAFASTVVDSSQSKDRIFKKLGSSGPAVEGIGIRVIDAEGHDLPPGEIGEVVLSGPNIVSEYYKQPKLTKEAFIDEWFRTGDLGYLDQDKELFIVDRKKDIIIRGGANIYPRDIEDVICKHSKVAESAVIGVPDKIFGEEIKAFVVTYPKEKASEDEIRRHCASLLAEYKVPKYIEFLEQLPKSKATEKVLKKSLRTQ
jgi:long-chain acyl-CoA synthetase